MATYISLINYTQQGAAAIKESPARLDAARQLFKRSGAELKAWYLAMGQYDAVILSEAPNGETVAKLLLTIGALGNVRTQTFPVFSEDEYRKIVAALP